MAEEDRHWNIYLAAPSHGKKKAYRILSSIAGMENGVLLGCCTENSGTLTDLRLHRKYLRKSLSHHFARLLVGDLTATTDESPVAGQNCSQFRLSMTDVSDCCCGMGLHDNPVYRFGTLHYSSVGFGLAIWNNNLLLFYAYL
jgi:hypothetical protein